METSTFLANLLGDQGISQPLHSSLTEPLALDVLSLLADQATGAPDYKHIGKGWFHPSSRLEYRTRTHQVFTQQRSSERQEESRRALWHDVSTITKDPASFAHVIRAAFLREIGVDAAAASNWGFSLQGLHAALKSELLMPLRALNECDLRVTMEGGHVPARLMEEAVAYITRAVVEGNYPGALYDHPLAKDQLAGLSENQVGIWRRDERQEQGNGGLATVDEGGLEVFWATKIGGPSHGFDYEGQCLMPLVCNARHKVILVHDPLYPHNAAGRSHLRLLHVTATRKPILYLEPTNVEFLHRPTNYHQYLQGTIRHAMRKAASLGIPLSVDTGRERELRAELDSKRFAGSIVRVNDSLLLAPSAGVVEASDTLTSKHDWVQTSEEHTPRLARVLFIPE
eukprot:CAMPEP_0117681788 /NCGR_PEP_ID=MMETSP0804-20121206/19205_1 /TAXON_ID=1074897 /ORGANISM="Tetraselmis astigmatica, Strain CCMP880" /LENGTH=397 /DNA_ID=CAMNT_0005491641 /DNA_START=241 /DNA_END=1434 /DNA_ORIENTATION=-